MNQITAHLWLGDEHSARGVQQLTRRNITLVVSVMTHAHARGRRSSTGSTRSSITTGIEHHHFDAVDCEVQDLCVIAPAVHALIDRQRTAATSGVQVHCYKGRSRSAACVVHHLMRPEL